MFWANRRTRKQSLIVDKKRLLKALIAWHRRSARDLPWRRKRDPYSVMVSEFMLIQTTVITVTPRYGQFLKTFPTLGSLAKAKMTEVLAAWSGLGYYSRAKNLWLAAREIHRLGYFPKSPEELKKLPGFGPYLSSAVSSFAFNVKTPVIDTNVRRALSRVFGPAGQEFLQDLLNHGRLPAGQINEAFMELGALICRAKTPLCRQCPVYDFCPTRGEGNVRARPARPTALELGIRLRQDGQGRYFLTLRGRREIFLKNTWGFPLEILKACPGGESFAHSITRYRIHAHVRRGHNGAPANEKGRWVREKDLKRYLVSSLWWKALKDRVIII